MELSTSHQTHSESDSILYASPTLPTPDGHPLAGLKKIHSVPYGADRLSCQTQVPGRGVAKRQWKAAALKIKDLEDPWAGALDQITEEIATRHMYNPQNGRWRTDEVIVKIQPQSFAHGAMRECFRMKKLSKFSQHPDWSNASNYVAKRYMKEVPREVYFEDVKLQTDAKQWGEEYSRFNPPKKVDFFQTYIIELKREDSPLYCVEHLIDGNYIKYNSNSGFVSEVNRLTPQAFSHFTFERSNHKIIVVDIQGVGDLYTDPQIHTADQQDYGEANLGTRGMALFFSSHICNPLCQALGLTQFDLSDKELDRLGSQKWNFSSAATAIHLSRSEPLMVHCEGGGGGRETVHQAFRRMSLSINHQLRNHDRLNSDSRGYLPPESPLDIESPGLTMFASSSSSSQQLPDLIEGEAQQLPNLVEGEGSKGDGSEGKEERERGRELPDLLLRTEDCNADEEDVECGSCKAERDEEDSQDSQQISSSTAVRESEALMLAGLRGNSLSSASAEKELTRLREGGDHRTGEEGYGLKMLGQVHMDLAMCHEIGRFSVDQTPDWASAAYHLRKAAECGHVSALFTLAHIYLQHPHNEFKDITVEASPANDCLGMEFLVCAAEGGLKVAMVEAARAYDSGQGLGIAGSDGGGGDGRLTVTQRTQDWTEAAKWYTESLKTPADGDDDQSPQGGISDPTYTILSRLAEMYRTGGHGLGQDCQKSGELYSQAAEEAMVAMKGKVANRFYVLAEEAWAEIPEEDEGDGD